MKNIQFLATNLELTDSIKDYATKRIESMSQLTSENALVKFEIERKIPAQHKGEVYRAEVHITFDGKEVYADATNEDMYAAIDEVRDIVQSQLTKASEYKRDVNRKEARKAKEQFLRGE